MTTRPNMSFRAPGPGAYWAPPPPMPALSSPPLWERLLAKVFDRRRVLRDVAPFRPQDGGVMRTPDGAVYVPDITPPVRPILGFIPRHFWQCHGMANRSQIQALSRYVEALSTELRSVATHLADDDQRRVLTLIGDATIGDGTW